MYIKDHLVENIYIEVPTLYSSTADDWNQVPKLWSTTAEKQMNLPRIFAMLATLAILFGEMAGASNLVLEQSPEGGKTTSSAQKKKGSHTIQKHDESDNDTTDSALGSRFTATPVGGNGGQPFDDQMYIPRKATVACLDLHTGMWIDSIRTFWGNPSDRASLKSSQLHGGSGGQDTAVWIPKGEHIIAVEGCVGNMVTQLSFITNKTRYGPYGKSTNDRPFIFQAPKGFCIVGFQGRAGLGIDQLAPIYQRIQ
jgi:hypothetical protein